jgi:hypothetical protein
MLNMYNSDISKEIPIKYQTFMNVQVAFNIVSMSILFKEFMAKMCIYTCLQTEVYVIYNISHTHTLTQLDVTAPVANKYYVTILICFYAIFVNIAM